MLWRSALFQWHYRGMDESKEMRTQLRMPAKLHGQLVAAAKKSGRSMNAEIVYRLEQGFSHPEGLVGRELVSDVLGFLVEHEIIKFTEGGSGLMTNLRARIQREQPVPGDEIPPKGKR